MLMTRASAARRPASKSAISFCGVAARASFGMVAKVRESAGRCQTEVNGQSGSL
jgi:hypothetical protein